MRLVKRIFRKTKKKIKKMVYHIKPDTFTPLAPIERKGKTIWLLGTEDFGNLGDHMIAQTIIDFIDDYFPEYECIEVSARNYFDNICMIAGQVKPEDIILGTGGGNFGNQYPASQQIRDNFVKRFPNNKIVIMPETIWFTGNVNGQTALANTISEYQKHKNLTIVAREVYSYDFLRENFKNQFALVPDIVLYSRRKPATHKNKDKAVICLRNDLEGTFSKEERRKIIKLVKSVYKKVVFIDTQKLYQISTSNRRAELEECFDVISDANVVITDRLHGMIFSVISYTPCIVFSNYNPKVKGIYEWIKDIDTVIYQGKNTDIKDVLKNIRHENIVQNTDSVLDSLQPKFEELAKLIRQDNIGQ